MLLLLIISALPWLLLFVYQVSRRGFAVFLLWLLIAPLVTYFVDRSEQSILFQSSGTDDWSRADFYHEHRASITLQELIDPTRTLIGLFLVSFVLNAALKKTRWVPLDKTEMWMGLFSIFLLASVILWSGRLAFGLRIATDSFIVPFLAYFFTRRQVISEDRLQRLMRAIGYMGVYVIVFSLIDRFTTPELFYRVRGPFRGRDVLSVVMVVVFFTTLVDSLCNKYILAGKYALPALSRWFVLLMAPVVILLTITRGNWIAFLTGVFVFLFLARRSISFSRQVGTIGLALILLPMIVIILQLAVPAEFFDERVSNPENVMGRLATWIATIQIASEAPILGIGLNNLHGVLSREAVSFGGVTNYSTPHNSFLSIFVELGAIGLVTYCAVFTTILMMGLSVYLNGNHVRDRLRGAALIAIIFAYLTPSLFSNIMYVPGLIHIYVYVFAGAIAGLYGGTRSISKRYAFALPEHGRRTHQLAHERYDLESIR